VTGKKQKKKQQGPKRPEQSKKPEKAQKPELKEYLKKLMPLIKAFALWFVLVIIIQLPGIREAFRDFIVGITTTSTVFLGKILFIPIERTGFSGIRVNDFSMQIIVECTAYNFYLFAIALAIFAEWKWKDKLINFLIFFAVIFFVNNLRFFAMGYVGRHYPEFFDTTHDYVWNILFGFLIFGIWAWRDLKTNIHLRKQKPATNETEKDS
jgi:exosortase/archaeosortase family protein